MVNVLLWFLVMKNVVIAGLGVTFIRSTDEHAPSTIVGPFTRGDDIIHLKYMTNGHELEHHTPFDPYYIEQNRGITTWGRPELPPYPIAPPRPPKHRLPVAKQPMKRGPLLTAGGWRLWWRGACVGGRGSWVAPGWRGPARARVWVCSLRGLMGWWAVWAWLVCVDVGYVCAEGTVGWAGALWAMQWVEDMLATPTGGVL